MSTARPASVLTTHAELLAREIEAHLDGHPRVSSANCSYCRYRITTLMALDREWKEHAR